MRDDSRAGMAAIAAFTLAFPFGVAGSLMIAPAVAVMALIAFPVDPAFWKMRRPPWALILGALFLVWLLVSILWSPHDDPGQAWRTGLGVPLYLLFALRAGRIEGRWQRRVETAILFTVLALGLFLLAETLLDGAITRGFKLAEEGFDEATARQTRDFVNRSLGHAAVPLILLAMPMALISWREGGPLVGLVCLVLGYVAAFSFSTEVNAVAISVATIAALLALKWPRSMVALSFGLVAGGLIVLPLILPDIISSLPDSVRSAMPHSWEMRLEIWSYVCDLIADKPWFGYGLDASRPLSGEFVFNGREFEALPLHPHNATLHIWLETGAVGAILAATGLVALGGQIAAAPQLSRLQAVAVVWVLAIYVSLIVFSYGVWQEWHQGTVALAATSVFFLGAKRSRSTTLRA